MAAVPAAGFLGGSSGQGPTRKSAPPRPPPPPLGRGSSLFGPPPTPEAFTPLPLGSLLSLPQRFLLSLTQGVSRSLPSSAGSEPTLREDKLVKGRVVPREEPGACPGEEGWVGTEGHSKPERGQGKGYF